MMVYNIEFYAYLPNEYFFFFIWIKGRILIRIFFHPDLYYFFSEIKNTALDENWISTLRNEKPVY